MSKYIPFPAYADDVPLDLSFIYKNEKPAGKHGFSLTDESIEKSDNILLTTVGRAVNTDAKFDGDQMLDYGKPPILVEVIEAETSLKTECSTLRVWAVNAEGFYIGAVSTTYENGILKFTL